MSMNIDNLELLLGDGPQPHAATYTWATLTSKSPLRIRVDGETNALGVDIETVTPLNTLAVGQRVLVLHQRSKMIIIGPKDGGNYVEHPIVKDIWTDSNYAPQNSGVLPTSEATAMIVVSGNIPVKPYDQIVMGSFSANFSGSSSSGNHIFYAGVQFFATGTNPATDSQFHAQMVRNDTSTTNMTISLPFYNIVPAGTASSYRMLQWGSASGYTVTDGNGIAYYILAMPAY